MTAIALIFTLASIGISETTYLIRKRINLQKPMCPIGEDCSKVLESKYNKVFIIPNDVAGFLAYIAVMALSALLVIGVAPGNILNTLLLILLSFSSLVSIFFTYLQSQVIKAWCFWCLMSATTIWLMEIILLTNKF